MAKKSSFRKNFDKVWPQTKKELEKALTSTKKALIKGERYLKQVSDRSVVQTKKLSLGLQKEKLYYDLGKAVSASSLAKISSNKKVDSLLKKIKGLDQKIKKIK